IYSPYVVDYGLLNNMGCAKEIEEMLEIKVYEIGGQQEIFTSKVWRRLFDINEKKYTKLCHEFHCTSAFDEVCADDELRTKKVINISSEEELHLSRSIVSTIRHPILRVLQKMITYEVCPRTTGYDKMQRNELWLMSKFEAKHQNGYVNVAWLMEKWLKRKGVGSQRDSMIFHGQFM
ncbi:hypothetical protein Tco_1261726, partial [Tanacetum coccineum]